VPVTYEQLVRFTPNMHQYVSNNITKLCMQKMTSYEQPVYDLINI